MAIVRKPVTVKRTVLRSSPIYNTTPVISRTAIIERAPIVRRSLLRNEIILHKTTIQNATNQNATIIDPTHISQRTTTMNPTPFIQCETIIHQSTPACRYGFHWAWIDPVTRLGMCVKDYENNCQDYDYKYGVCRICRGGFNRTLTSYHDYFCLQKGHTLPNLKVLREGNSNNNRTGQADSDSVYESIIIAVVIIVAVVLIVSCLKGNGVGGSRSNNNYSNSYNNGYNNYQSSSYDYGGGGGGGSYVDTSYTPTYA